MKKVLEHIDRVGESMDNSIKDSVDKIYAYIFDAIISSREYDIEKRRYMDLKRNGLEIPSEMKFIYSLPKHQALDLISIIRSYTGSFYFPGKYSYKEYEKEKLYYHAKLDFIARKKHQKYTIPDDEIPQTVLKSVFPNKESMDIAYGIYPKKKCVGVNIFADFSDGQSKPKVLTKTRNEDKNETKQD